MKYIADKIITPKDLEDYYNLVDLELFERDNNNHKIIHYIFMDNSSVKIEYTLTGSKIIEKTNGKLPIRQPY